MNTIEIAKKYVELVKEHKYEACLKELFASDAVSVEAGAPPGKDRTAKGIEAIAVCLLHSYANADHERQVADLIAKVATVAVETMKIVDSL